jgi:hypothetical protein
MENLARRRAYNAHYEYPELVAPIFALFRTTPGAEYLMRDLATASSVRITTLYSWRERFRTDPQWRPLSEHFAQNRCVFSDHIKLMFANFISIIFMESGRSLTRVALNHPF